MNRKQIRICSLFLTVVLIAALTAGCASGGANSVNNGGASESASGGAPEAKGNSFDYGITVNVPEDWKTGTYKATAEENPEHWYITEYPLLYGIHYDYIKDGETYGLFSVYVFNAVDWNEIALGTGEVPPFGYQIKKNNSFAYVISDLPSENPFGDERGDEFNAMCEFMWDGLQNGFNKAFTIRVTDRKPTATESRNKTVECAYGYFAINIPTSWDCDELDISYESFDVMCQGYEAEYMVRYALKTDPDSSEDLFVAYLLTGEVWAQMEADADGGPTPVAKVAENDDYVLAVLLPQDNPMDRDSDIGKKFDSMVESAFNFDAFYKLF